MSTRHLLSIGMGTVALLLAVSVGVVFTSLDDEGMNNSGVELAKGQQTLIRNLSYQVEALAGAGNLMDVNQARQELGATILDFDQNLTALLHGGTVSTEEGKEIHISQASSSLAKSDLGSAAELWIETGLPLADLAAGEFSIFSSAGQSAVASLEDNKSELVNLFGQAATSIQAEAQSRHARGSLARWFALAFTASFIGLGIFRFKPSKQIQNQSPAPAIRTAMNHSSPNLTEDKEPAALPTPAASAVWNSSPHQPFTSPVDFDNVNASVDQLSVDMNTIANSTNKMQLAIDSVGNAMQGMLFSLNQMAQDSAEGYKIVRGANNAASFTHNTAGELTESAREMSRVVARVTQLAMKTKQVASQIEAEAVHTGQTGEAFTSVVAGEVKGLARQTSQATAGIEQTVAEIMGTARHYEEAIGQIIKNISAINKVSENLGELMLQPPAAGVAGTPLPSAPVAPLTPQPVAVPPAAAEPVPAPVVEAAPAPTPAPEPRPAPEPEAIADKDENWTAPAEEPSVEEVAEETTAAIEETAADPEPSGSGGNVFMLGGGAKKPKAPEAPKPAPEPAPAPEAKSEAPAVAQEKNEDEDSNIFMLNKPKKNAEPAAEKPAAPAPEPVPEPAPEPEAAAAAEPAPAEEDEDEGPNIYMLKRPSKTPAAEKKAPEVKKEAVTVPAADEDEAKDDGGGNIFMLNKPKG
jgi:hypothetical protein